MRNGAPMKSHICWRSGLGRWSDQAGGRPSNICFGGGPLNTVIDDLIFYLVLITHAGV
jgi:hypothetical protein